MSVVLLQKLLAPRELLSSQVACNLLFLCFALWYLRLRSFHVTHHGVLALHSRPADEVRHEQIGLLLNQHSQGGVVGTKRKTGIYVMRRGGVKNWTVVGAAADLPATQKVAGRLLQKF